MLRAAICFRSDSTSFVAIQVPGRSRGGFWRRPSLVTVYRFLPSRIFEVGKIPSVLTLVSTTHVGDISVNFRIPVVCPITGSYRCYLLTFSGAPCPSFLWEPVLSSRISCPHRNLLTLWLWVSAAQSALSELGRPYPDRSGASHSYCRPSYTPISIQSYCHVRQFGCYPGNRDILYELNTSKFLDCWDPPENSQLIVKEPLVANLYYGLELE